MARDLVPIKIKILRKGGNGADAGHAQYPAFNSLQATVRNRMDWSLYVDLEGPGWHYDTCCGHDVDTAESPFGQQWGALLVPKPFADAALVQFPGEVTKLSEAEFEDFYDNHATSRIPNEKITPDVISAINLKVGLNQTLTPNDLAALDPENDKIAGIVRNKHKTWAGLKAVTGTRIVQ